MEHISFQQQQEFSKEEELENLVADGERLYFDVPVFGDIHGNLEGLFTTVQRLQRRHGVKYRWVIQVGDFGFYPDASRCALVSGSSRVSDRELGVTNFLGSNQNGGALLTEAFQLASTFLHR